MKKTFSILALFCILLCLIACGTQQKENRLVEFKGRKINLKPYFEGFPYSGFTPFYEAGKLFYYNQAEKTYLKQIDMKGDVDLRRGVIVSDIDFSKRNVWGIRYRKTDGWLYWLGDEINDEVINLYRLDPATQVVEKLTNVPYTFGWRWDPEKQRVAYIARLGTKEDRLGELRLLDLETLEETIIVQDDSRYRFTWGSPSWQPQAKGIILPVLKNADRTYGNLAYIDLKTKKRLIITDAKKPRRFPVVFKEWLSDEDCLYLSDENDYRNIYRYNIRTGKTNRITKFERDVNDAELISIDGKKCIFAVVSNPIENDIYLIDPETSEILRHQNLDLNLNILDTRDNRLLVSANSATVRFRIDELTVDDKSFAFETRIDLPNGLEKKIVHTRVERVEYPTFDIDPKTGKKRMLHAFLYHPDKPLPKDEQIVMIQSFYGGGNYFSIRNQILAETGIFVFSPSPRGSDGFGAEFASLNDKDLGGNEIIDIIYAGKHISEKLGIPPERIGVFGGSHGGYATMRLLTFPGEINGNKARFDWGFGMSHAGFSDIIHFYQHCNIPDWVILEAGDPKTEAAKLNNRSPLYHADKMVGKLLLTHGTNDNRVPIKGSRAMADSLQQYGKDFKLVEFADQGHGIKGLENQIHYYNVWFDFLESIK